MANSEDLNFVADALLTVDPEEISPTTEPAMQSQPAPASQSQPAPAPQEEASLQFESIKPPGEVETFYNNFITDIDTDSASSLGPDEFDTRTRVSRSLEAQGVDVTSGAGNAVRAELSFATTDEDRKRILQQEFPDGFRETPIGPVVRVRDENGAINEVLLDETALTLNDFADLTETGTVLLSAVGGVAGVMAVAPAIVASPFAIPVLAIIGGIAGQAGGSLPEILSSASRGGLDLTTEQGRSHLAEIVKNRGFNAAIDSVLDMVFAGGFRLANRARNKIANPSADATGTPLQDELKSASARQGIDLSSGIASGNLTLQRLEGLLAKHPGSDHPLAREMEREVNSIRAAQQRITTGGPPMNQVGEDMLNHLNRQDRIMQEALESGASVEQAFIRASEKGVTAKLNNRIAEISDAMHSRPVALDEAGELGRLELQAEYGRFKSMQKSLEDVLESTIKLEAPDGFNVGLPQTKSAIASLKKRLPPKEFAETKTPQRTSMRDAVTGKKEVIPAEVEIKQKPNLAALPPGVKSIIDMVGELPAQIDISQVRYLRSTLNRIIDDETLFPGVDVGTTRLLLKAIGSDMRAAIKNAPTPNIAKAMEKAFSHFSENVDKFATDPVRVALKDVTDRGFKFAGADILPNKILQGKTGEVREFLAALPREARRRVLPVTRRAVFDEMLNKARVKVFQKDYVDSEVLAKQLRDLDKTGVSRVIFNETERKQLDETINTLALQQNKDIDFSGIKSIPSDKRIVDIIKQARDRQKSIDDQFSTKSMADMATSGTPNWTPDEFVMQATKLPRGQFNTLFNRFGKEQQDEFRKSLLVYMFDKAARKSAVDEKIVSSLSGDIPVGKGLIDVMRTTFGKTADVSMGRLKGILGEEMFHDIMDIAVVQSAREARDKAVGQVGNMAAGQSLANMLKEGTLTKIMRFRVAGAMFKSKAIRNWIKRDNKLEDPTARRRAFFAVLPQLKDVLTQELGESETVNKVIDMFADGAGADGVVDE